MDRVSIRSLIALGFALRIALALFAIRELSLPVQPDDYLGLGRELLAGRYDNVLFPPGFAAVCAGAVFLLGKYAVVAVVLLQAVLSAANIALVNHITLRLGALARLAKLAALGMALEPTVIVAVGLVYSETLYSTLILVMVDLLLSGDGVFSSVAAGLILGAATMVRSIGVVVAPIVVFWILLRPRASARSLGLAAVFAGTFLLLLAPLSVRNLHRFGHFAPSASGAFNVAALWIGPARARAMGVPAEANVNIWIDDFDPGVDMKNPFAVGEAARSAALRWARAHPFMVATSIVTAQATLWVSPWRGAWSAVLMRDLHGVELAALIGWRVTVFVLALLGIRAGCRMARPLRWQAALLFFIIVVHAAVIGSVAYGRFLLPIVSLLIVFAAFGVSALGETLRRRSIRDHAY